MRLVWAVVFTVIAIEYGRTAPLGALGFVAIAIAYLACYGPLNRSLSLRQMRGLPAGVSGPDAGPVTLTLTAGRLELTAPDGTVLLPPSPVRRTDESAGHYFLYVAPSAAIIVPRSGVAKGDPGDFIRAVRASRAPS